jgi:hypothetical protein
MAWEYRQIQIPTKGWIEIKVNDNYIRQLNILARDGWEVDQMMPIHTGISGTSSIVVLLKRHLDSGQYE